MEVMHNFRDDLVDRVPEDLWTEVLNIVQKEAIASIPKKKKGKKAKWLSDDALQIAMERKVYPNEFRIPENSKER